MQSPKRPNVLLLASLRRFHVYLSMFVAPSVIFFAATGGLQIFGLHEASNGVEPPAVLAKLGQLHKNQTLVLRPKRPTPAPGAKPKAEAAPHTETPLGPPPARLALKLVWAGAALGMIFSSGLGIAMVVVHHPRRNLMLGVLALGTLLPLLLALLA